MECSGYVGLWDKRFVVTSSFPLPVNSSLHMYFVLFKPLSCVLMSIAVAWLSGVYLGFST